VARPFYLGGTLLCCVLPVLLVSLGLGTAVASLTSSAPWLVELSRHKEWIFAASFLMLRCATATADNGNSVSLLE
jgi:hypothetical protein